MKRIGILTFHRPINYGAFLQAFSLSERLKKECGGCCVEIIDYIAPKEKRQIQINILREIKHHFLKGGYHELCKIKAFRRSLKHLSLSQKTICTQHIDVLYRYIDENYDMLIIGSDAVFNWNQNGFPSAFIPDYPFQIPVLSYAASVHGLRYREEPPERTEICSKVFGQMAYIGTRDRNTENFVRYCNASAVPHHNCDPTVFIDSERICELAGNCEMRLSRKYGFSKDKPYLVVMLPNEKFTAEIYERFRDRYTIVSAFKKNRYSDVFLYDLNPFEWAWLLKHASLVITSYFHGTLLGLVQGTPVIALDYSGMNIDPYEGKLKDLMERRFELDDMYFDAKQDQRLIEHPEILLDRAEELLCDTCIERIGMAVRQERGAAEAFWAVCRQITIEDRDE